ncbi:unnamed protein product, partial [Cylindrotheca closterium]
MGKYVQAQRK